MTHDEMIAVIQAHKDGKKLEVANKGCNNWIDLSTNGPCFNFKDVDYRVKPVDNVAKIRLGMTLTHKNGSRSMITALNKTGKEFFAMGGWYKFDHFSNFFEDIN